MAQVVDNTEGEDTLYRDVLLQLVGIFILITALIMLVINDPKKNQEEAIEHVLGTLNIEIVWDHTVDVDVDLWVLTPISKTPVNYTNKANNLVNLIRDDLGKTNDAFLNLNYENVLSRGIAPGEYSVVVHMYSTNNKIPYPITVQTAVTAFSETGGRKQLLEREVILKKHNEQITVFTFILTKDGGVVPGSVNYIPVELVRGKAY